MARHLGVVAVDNRQQGAVVCHSRRRGRRRQGAANPVKPNPYGAYFKGGLARKVPGDGAERNTEWTRAGWARLEPFTEGYYVNLGESQQDVHAHRVQRAYGDNYPRLAALKKRYDPANLLRLNANIKPA